MSNQLQVEGRIIEIGQTEQVSEKFSKRNFVIEIKDGAYNKNVAMQFTGDKCSVLDKYEVNQNVLCSINLDSRKYNEKWYTNITCWKIEAQGGAAQQSFSANATDAEKALMSDDTTDSGLPF